MRTTTSTRSQSGNLTITTQLETPEHGETRQRQHQNHVAFHQSPNSSRSDRREFEISDETNFVRLFTPTENGDHAIDISSNDRSENTAEFQKLNSAMLNKKCILEELQKSAVDKLGGRYVASKSEGLSLQSLNDHVGILHLTCKHAGVKIGETLAVVKDKVKLGDGTYEEAYFIKGYGNRLVSLQDVEEILARLEVDQIPKDETAMETHFRGFLKYKSEKSVLFARRLISESATPVMPVPPNAMPLPRCSNWANAENYIGHSFGEKQPASVPEEERSYYLGYTDYNAIENRLMIFLTSPETHKKERPMQERAGVSIPASVNIEGSVLAEIQGILHVEVMGPAGKEVGVKLGKLKECFSRNNENKNENKILRITTEDGAIHQLEFTPTGLKMKLLQPMASKSEIMTPNENADVSVYGYQGRNTGLHGNTTGYANPELILSTGERLLAGPLHSNRSGVDGHARQLGTLMAHVATLTPTVGANSNVITSAINTALRAACVAAVVYGLNNAIEAAKDPETKTLFGGDRTFSSSGAGSVTSGHLAYVIGLIVVAQTSCTAILNFAYDNFLKDAWKSKETTKGQFLNEVLMPFASEFLRLMINYGLQSSLGLPRGNGYDIASLAGNAVVNTAVNFSRARSGSPENHPTEDVIYKAVEFSVGDLLFRSLGAVAGDPNHKGSIQGIDYAEALVTRLGTRGVDKLALPIMLTVLSAAGIVGPNAGAYDEQITLENRHNGALAYLRGLFSDLNRLSSKKTETLDDAMKKNIESLANIFHSTAVLVEGLKKGVNRLGINFFAAEENELALAIDAASFGNLTSDTERMEYLKTLTEKFNEMCDGHSVENNTSQLPDSMKEDFKKMVQDFRKHFQEKNDSNYPSRPSPDFLSGTLRFDTTVPTFGKKTNRIQQELTTFSSAPARHIGNVHNAMASAKSIAKHPDDSNPYYQKLTKQIIRDIRDSVVKYTQESGPFHYLLRWNNTGQDHYIEIAPGIDLRVAMMNKRGNTRGSRESQISAMDPLIINLGALHAESFPAIVHRAVVTDAHYIENLSEKKSGSITVGDRISLTEILSATSAETLAAAFLAALGYGAAVNSRNQRIVIKQDTSINIAKYTELMQAESIAMPGAIYIVKQIDSDLEIPENEENLGQVVYVEQLDTYKSEKNYRAYRRVMENRNPTDDDLEILNNLEDGATCIHPDTGHFYRYNKSEQKMEFEIASKNYFLGTDIETDPNQAARWRFPFTAPSGPAEVRRAIRASILTDDAMARLLNDAVRNIHHEAYRRLGGYYDKDSEGNYTSRDKIEDDELLKRRIELAETAKDEIESLTMSTELFGEIEKGKKFPGELLARLFSTALAKPLMFLAVDDTGQIKLHQNNENKPLQLALLTKTHDHMDMQWDASGATMLGVGNNGYYAMTYQHGDLTASPVEISGKGLTAGNLLHAIAINGYPQQNQNRYKSEKGVIKSATTESDLRTQGLPDRDKTNNEMKGLLDKLKKFAASEYIPIQQWLSDTYEELGQDKTLIETLRSQDEETKEN